MCGIIGIFNVTNHQIECTKATKMLKYRGNDGNGIFKSNDYSIGHTLHSMEGSVIQPLQGKGILTTNCEIYNWRELAKQFNYNVNNDAELLLKLFDDKGISTETLNLLDGVYSFIYVIGNTVYSTRDSIGIKPNIYSFNNGELYICSDKSVLLNLGLHSNTIIELNPRKIIQYNIQTKQMEFIDKPFFKLNNLSIENDESIIIKRLHKLTVNAIKKRIPTNKQIKIGLLFSGGLDSLAIALILKELNVDFTCYVTGIDRPEIDSKDVTHSIKVAKILGLNLKVIPVNENTFEQLLTESMKFIEDNDVIKTGVSATFNLACKQAKKDGVKLIFSGGGSEDIFAGYNRHLECYKTGGNVNKECLEGLRIIHKRDLYRDDMTTMNNSLEIRLPLLDHELIEYALNINQKFKIKNDYKKYIFRLMIDHYYNKDKNITKYIWRKKMAAQYGSNINWLITKFSKANGYGRHKTKYLKSLYTARTSKVPIAALVSTGKDSMFALWKMKEQNYDIKCMITIESSNDDSYMFHTPTIELAKEISKVTGIPLIICKTEGIKEQELNDLEKAINKAINKYNIQGITSGAVASEYQKTRIETICDKLGIISFTPLWNYPQEQLIKDLIDQQFKIMITKVAADGLDPKQWLGKIIDLELLNNLIKLNKINGVNVAGEGGEYETLVINAPYYDKEIKFEFKCNYDKGYVEIIDNK